VVVVELGGLCAGAAEAVHGAEAAAAGGGEVRRRGGGRRLLPEALHGAAVEAFDAARRQPLAALAAHLGHGDRREEVLRRPSGVRRRPRLVLLLGRLVDFHLDRLARIHPASHNTRRRRCAAKPKTHSSLSVLHLNKICARRALLVPITSLGHNMTGKISLLKQSDFVSTSI